jgi:hypothetical protein
MRRSAQGLIVALLLGGLATIGLAAAPFAHADDAVSVKPKALQSNWFWYQQAQRAEGTGLEALPEPSGVPAGDLAVAYTPGGTPQGADEPSKETLLAFDLSGWPKDASVSSFSFTLKVDGPAQVKTSQPDLIACLPQGLWSNGAGDPYVEKPAIDCSTSISATGRYDAGSTSYTFSIPAIAQRWISDVNTGVSIRQATPKSGDPQPFQLTFTGANTVTATASYLPAVPVPPASSTTEPNPQPGTAADAGSSGTGSSGGLGVTNGGGTTPTTDAGVAAPPAVAAPQLAPQPAAAIAHIGKAGSLPSPGFWLFGVGLLVLLALVSLVLGDSAATPAAAAAGRPRGGSRLDRALRARRLSANPPMTLEPR